jgi:hypothetical protein
MPRVVVIFYVFFFLLSSCEDSKVTEVIEETQEQIDAKTITQTDIEAIRYDDFGLRADSQKATTDWQKFQELKTQIEVLKKADLTYFSGDPLLIQTLLQEMRTEMPSDLNTNEISARITALDTKTQKLNSLLRLAHVSKADKIKVITEFLIAVSNLNLQINKKFEFDTNNILKPQ